MSELSLNMGNDKDRGLVREAIKRWPDRWKAVREDIKTNIVNGLDEASTAAREAMREGDPDHKLRGAHVMASVAKTLVAIEAQRQADDHEIEKYARLDNGQATDRTEVIVMPPPTLPRLVRKELPQ